MPLEVELLAVVQHEIPQAVLVTLGERLLEKGVVFDIPVENIQERVVIIQVRICALPVRDYPVEIDVLDEVVLITEMVIKSLARYSGAILNVRYGYLGQLLLIAQLQQSVSYKTLDVYGHFLSSLPLHIWFTNHCESQLLDTLCRLSRFGINGAIENGTLRTVLLE